MPWWPCAAIHSSSSLFFVNLKHLQVNVSFMIKILIFVLASSSAVLYRLTKMYYFRGISYFCIVYPSL